MAPTGLFEGIVEAPSLEEVTHRLGDTLVGDRFGTGEELRKADEAAQEAYAGVMEDLRNLDVPWVTLPDQQNRVPEHHITPEGTK